MNKRILSILVENTAGVLSRVSGLFSRRGYNIDSLSVGITTDPNYSRMTVVCRGDELILEQLKLDENEKQLLEHIVKQMETERGLDRSAAIAHMRFDFIEKSALRP